MKKTDINSQILKSRIFWKMWGWNLVVIAAILGFTAFIILSALESELGSTLSAGKTAGTYALLKKQIFIILAILYVLFAFLALFSARLLALRIIRTYQHIKKVHKMQTKKELNISTNDEFKEMALDLNNLAVKLKEYQEKKIFIDKIKSDFVTIAAHQLRTPLSKVKWALHALQEGKLNKEQTKYVKDGIDTSEHMITLINNLLNVSRIEQGKFDYNFQNADIKKVIRKTIKEHRPQCKKSGLKLSSRLYKEELTIKHDPEKIKMVMDNMLSNAIKYTPENGKVHVSATIKGDVVEVAVKDTGMGIPESEQPKIFQKFYRGEKMKIDTEGNGLGLFISKSIVEKHGGKMKFNSKQGKGTTFYFTLPIKDREDPQKSFEELINKV